MDAADVDIEKRKEQRAVNNTTWKIENIFLHRHLLRRMGRAEELISAKMKEGDDSSQPDTTE